jgi:hypothetical protein
MLIKFDKVIQKMDSNKFRRVGDEKEAEGKKE